MQQYQGKKECCLFVKVQQIETYTTSIYFVYPIYLTYENKCKAALIPSHIPRCNGSTRLRWSWSSMYTWPMQPCTPVQIHTCTNTHLHSPYMHTHQWGTAVESENPTNVQTADFDKILGSILWFPRDSNDS